MADEKAATYAATIQHKPASPYDIVPWKWTVMRDRMVLTSGFAESAEKAEAAAAAYAAWHRAAPHDTEPYEILV